MNPATEAVIEFLTHPELNFGTQDDIFLFNDPDALRECVRALLQQPREFLAPQAEANLHSHFDAVEWPLVAQEFRSRVQMASRFFDPDAETHRAGT